MSEEVDQRIGANRNPGHAFFAISTSRLARASSTEVSIHCPESTGRVQRYISHLDLVFLSCSCSAGGITGLVIKDPRLRMRRSLLH